MHRLALVFHPRGGKRYRVVVAAAHDEVPARERFGTLATGPRMGSDGAF